MNVSLTTQEVKLLSITLVDPELWLTQLAKVTAQRNKMKLTEGKAVSSAALDKLLDATKSAKELQDALDVERGAQ